MVVVAYYSHLRNQHEFSNAACGPWAYGFRGASSSIKKKKEKM